MVESNSRHVVIGIAGAAIVATGVGLYMLGTARSERQSPEVRTALPDAGRSVAATATPAAAVPSIEAAAERLATRLNANDGTGDDWALLARSYVQMKRYPEAVGAFDKALQKMPGTQAFVDGRAAAQAAMNAQSLSK